MPFLCHTLNKPTCFILLLLSAQILFMELCFAENLSCPSSRNTQTVTVNRIIDGDTLRLTDGRKIRLIGVNTPELGYKNKTEQPLAWQAKAFATNFFSNDGLAKLQLGIEKKDRYGRWLGHIFNAKDQSLGAALLAQGYAFHIVIPPNTNLSSCLANIEAQAKHQQKGLWKKKNYSTFTKPQAGYRRITASVKTVQFKHFWWVMFEGNQLDNFTAVIKPEAQKNIPKAVVENWIGKSLELEGWLYEVSHKQTTRLQLNIYTSDAVTILK